MGLRNRLIAAVTALAALAPSGWADAEATKPGRFVDGRVLVRFRDDATAASRADALARVGGRTILTLPVIEHHLVRLGQGLGVLDAVRRLRAHDAVEIAEPDHTGRIQAVSNDRCVTSCSTGTGPAKQWAPAAVNAPAGWDVYPGRFFTAEEKKALPAVRVAVLDTKIDVTRADWANPGANPSEPWDARNGGQLAVSLGADFVPPANQQGTAAYHGTFVAGLLGAATNNTVHLAGIGYPAQIVPITVVDGAGNTTASALAQGILHAVSVGARVINMSLGISGYNSTVQRAIDSAWDSGALSIAAAGNNANDSPFWPAWNNRVMAVSASDEADRPGACTNHSLKTSVAAPGAGVVGLDPRTASGLSVVACGTSTATPHVSGLAALLFGQDPLRTPEQVRQIIEASADDDRFRPGRDDWFGRGRINVERALRYGDGSPVVTAVRATPPAAQGGSATITAYATVVSERPILDAEFFLDAPVAPGQGSPIEPADGTWGGTTETLTTDIVVGTGVTAGVHRLYVRAFDGLSWGASSSGVLIVDRTPPRISQLTATNPVTPATPLSLSFRVDDDFSQQASYVLRVTSQVTGALAYESEPVVVDVPSLNAATWTPAATDVGPHRVELLVTDESVNTARAAIGVIVL